MEASELATLLPPPTLARGHGGDQLRELGDRWAMTLQTVGGLEPTDRVLDVGCGPGRMALALACVLGEHGTYDGFDITRADIEWCQAEIEPRWAQAHFRHVDVRNEHYNPEGRLDASDFRFPYEDARFDFCLLTSVFTHMTPAPVRQYLGELARVLRPGGRCLATWFLLNDSVSEAITHERSRFTFRYELEPGCRIEREDIPTKVVAYDEDVVLRMYEQAGLVVSTDVLHGGWSGVYDDVRHSQDIVVASAP
jgi:SAM-dependent methyltransferase